MTPAEKTVIKICACGTPVSEEKKQEIKQHYEKGMLIEYLKEAVERWKYFIDLSTEEFGTGTWPREQQRIKEIEAFISSLT